MDAKTQELRHAHDALAELYADKLADILDQMPVDRAVLGLFCDLLLENGVGSTVGDIGCGSGRLAPYLAGRGLEPHGVDLSPEMIRVALGTTPRSPSTSPTCGVFRSRIPRSPVSCAGTRSCISHRRIGPGRLASWRGSSGQAVYFATAFKAGDDQVRRGGRTVGVEFDIYWLSPEEMERQVTDPGFRVIFWAGRPADPDEQQPQGYLVAQRLRVQRARR